VNFMHALFRENATYIRPAVCFRVFFSNFIVSLQHFLIDVGVTNSYHIISYYLLRRPSSVVQVIKCLNCTDICNYGTLNY